MRRIDWKIFDTEFKALNQDHLSVAQVGKHGKITLSYLYRLFSKDHHPDTVTHQMAYRIARGLGLNPQKSQNWVKKLLRHTRDPKLRKLTQTQHPEKLDHRQHKSSQNGSSKNESAQESIERMRKQHPIVKFYPVGADQLSDLALHVKQLMGNEQISMKNLCKATYLNKQRLHDLFNGKQKTVSRLTAVRIADGLDVPLDSLLVYNHYTPKIKAVVMSDEGNGAPDDKKSLAEQIHELNDHDAHLIKDMVSRLLIAEGHESK